MYKVGDGQHPPLPDRLSEEGQHFLKACFIHGQNYRWTAHMLEDHPFVKVKPYKRIHFLSTMASNNIVLFLFPLELIRRIVRILLVLG